MDGGEAYVEPVSALHDVDALPLVGRAVHVALVVCHGRGGVFWEVGAGPVDEFAPRKEAEVAEVEHNVDVFLHPEAPLSDPVFVYLGG